MPLTILWIAFAVIVVAAVLLDVGVFDRRAHTRTPREAAIWTGVWFALAIGFGAAIGVLRGRTAAGQFYAGWLVEESLSIDNLFVFSLLFTHFAVPPELEHRALLWGIVGAIVLRGIFVALGVSLLARFHVMFYVFGAFLVITGMKLALKPDGREPHPERSFVVRATRRLIPVTAGYANGKLWVRERGRRVATPLLLVIVSLELSDVIFAVDSLPAVFGITTDPLIVYTSNIFAILGLRSLYALLSTLLRRFSRLQIGIAVLLVLVGAKMLIAKRYVVPTGVMLIVIASVILASIVASLIWPSRPSLPSPSSRPAEPSSQPAR